MEYDFATTPFSESEQNNAAVRVRGRDGKTTFGSNGKIQHENGIRDVVCCNEWGNCIDSFQSNRQQAPIPL